jgi:ABC-type transport system involved in multi-copper enzyme maturation permease subunit
MLFAFDIICGEKEAGTLRQTISNTVKRPILIIGKWIGGFTSFILPFFMAILLSTILVTLSPLVDMNAQNWAKLGLFLLIAVVYLAVFFSLGLLISCLTRHSSTALVISLFAWAVLVFLIPNMGNILARQLVRIPTVQQIELKREHIMIKDVVEAEYDGQPGHMTWAERGKRHRRENAQINEDYRNCFNRLVAKSQNITRFSPAAAFTFLVTDFMGTGVSDERRLRRAVLQYKSTSQDRGGKRPTFRYQRSSIKEVLGPKSLSDCLILILFNILFFSGAYVAFLRYDVR